ncbi:MAG: glycosyltransferase family 39 protein [Acidobacteria bacterium]|nr:glycosyltransferase family 39 protein [Acidobacteriota bacterium]
MLSSAAAVDEQDPGTTRRTLRRGGLALMLLAVAWAGVIAITGGVVIDAGPVHVTSRNPERVLLIAAVIAVATWLVDPRRGWHRRWAEDWRSLTMTVVQAVPAPLRRLAVPRTLAAVAAAATFLTGAIDGAHVVGGSDSYGYVSQAHMWATGTLKVPQPLADDLPPGISADVLVPLGYRLSTERLALVPTYAPGLPMTLAIFERLGGAQAVFFVVPLMGALLVWLTYRLGARTAGEVAGGIAALLIATSPTFVFQVMTPPMSDIAAAMWWTLALLAITRRTTASGLVAGVATAAAVLTRPNLVPLGLVPAAVVIAQWWYSGRQAADTRRALLFAIPAVLACFTVAAINNYWYGSPFESGYGNGAFAGGFFSAEYFVPNLTNYTQWIIDSQGLLIVLAIVGLLSLLSRHAIPGDRTLRIAMLALAAGVYACYALYLPFDAWWFLRFLMPALPMLFVLVAAGVLVVARNLPAGFRMLATITLIVAMLVHVTTFIRERSVYDSSVEWRYQIAGYHVRDHLPPNAVLLTMLHSGNVRYYSNRLTVRYDMLEPARAQDLLTHLRNRGYVTFALIDDAEDAAFRKRFAGTPLASRVSTPMVTLDRVRIYDLSPQ